MLLVQLPPDQERNDDRLDYFVRGLPEWMCVAVELRHPQLGRRSCLRPCWAATTQPTWWWVAQASPRALRAISTTVYLWPHGPDHDHLYAGSHGEADLHWWADRIREWAPVSITQSLMH